jgi:hypothetical protein
MEGIENAGSAGSAGSAGANTALLLYTDHTCNYTEEDYQLLEELVMVSPAFMVDIVLIKENMSDIAIEIMDGFGEKSDRISNTGGTINCIKLTEAMKHVFTEVSNIDYRLATDIHEIIGIAAFYRIFSKNGLNINDFYSEFLELFFPWNNPLYSLEETATTLEQFMEKWNVIFYKDWISHKDTFDREIFITRYSLIINDFKEMYKMLNKNQQQLVHHFFNSDFCKTRYSLPGEELVIHEAGFGENIPDPDTLIDETAPPLYRLEKLIEFKLEWNKARGRVGEDPWEYYAEEFESEFKSNFSIFIELPAIIKFVSYLTDNLEGLTKNVVISMGGKHFEIFENLFEFKIGNFDFSKKKFNIKINERGSTKLATKPPSYNMFFTDMGGVNHNQNAGKSSRKKKKSSRKKNKKSSRKKNKKNKNYLKRSTKCKVLSF